MHACLCVCVHVCVCATFNITQPQQICLGDYANACYVRICTSTNVHLQTSPVVYAGCCIDPTEELNLLWQSCPLQMPSVQSSTWWDGVSVCTSMCVRWCVYGGIHVLPVYIPKVIYIYIYVYTYSKVFMYKR